MHNTNYQGAQERPSTSRVADAQPGRSFHEPQSSQDTSDSVGFWGSPHASDFYLRNQLHSYSFGTAPRISNSPSSYPAATLDEAEYEELMARADTTPRPSVVAHSYQPLPRTSTWRDPGSGMLIGDSPHRTQANAPRDRANDSAPSSASASVTSFNDSLYAGSVVSQDSSSVPHTPINEFTSSEEDEDRSRRRRSDFSISGPYPTSSTNASTTSMEFSSEEEYDSDDVPDFEISSNRVASVDMSFQEEEYSTYTQERRGSLPMVIPGTPSISGQCHFGHDRADNLVTVRRPSRSLDDDLSIIEAMRNHSSRTRPDDDSLPSPVSMPGSEGDWRNLNARVIRRGSAIQTTGSFYDYSDASSQKQPSSSKAIDVGEFDLDWADLRQGIVSMDQTDLGDIVRLPARPFGGSRWFPRFGGSSNQNNDARRPSIATISSLGSDTFGKAVFRWGGEGYQSQRHDWTFKREKIATIAHQTPVTSGNATARGFSGFLGTKPLEDERKRSHKEREKEKDRLSKVMASWRGMPIDSQEIWKMDLIGRFRVERRATKTADLAKGPQQRVIVHRLREIDYNAFHAYTVPTSTVHKHSKAVAFSIGRYYRRKSDNKEKPREVSNGGPLITASHPPAPPSESQNRHGSMALLAPRRVQIAFTNTTSTRKLESHGLLDEDQPRRAIREHPVRRDREREKRDKNKGKAREKQPSGRKQDAAFGEASERGLLASFASSSAVNLTGSSRATNASGSASVMTSTTMVSSIPSTPSSLSADLNASSSHVSTLAAASGKSVTDLSTNRPRRRRRRVHDPLELDEDDDYDDDGGHSPTTRTPHSETYGTVDASLIEQLYHERAQHELDTGSVFRKLFRSRNNKANVGAPTGHLEANYVPPWILLPSRSRQEQQQRVVENLNSSFMDVGLLPSTHRTRKQGQTSKKKRDDQTNGILSEVPEESLYMLLPLWPGETDPISAQAHPHLLRRIPPTDCRQYLLIYYRSMDSRKKGDKKKRASPTADYERSDRTILLSSFHISARFVAHNELIGTGIRVPEEGLTISGPLDYAWETLPSAEVREDCKSDWVIGVCHCRESGVEFIPEGLVKMDLCQMSWKPPSAVNDKYIPPEPTLKLTPIGQAVVEMAWLGAIALTSFGQVGLV
ncbi:hypothetical protein M378DRAFT_178101 [Amanita muscaria Koide BX008]|uniref:Uncharacterized protein n=1 Tax=Amanita muscaria (strain Koide BX008) TaxID=946122 RepID=A0A0C2SRF7_AMAMK|nr:hypothetical protein M378DRAFT_178101 [Amanita muscaria Koide BX008]